MKTRGWAILGLVCTLAVALDRSAAVGAGLPIKAAAWSWSNPAPQGEGLDDVAFAGARGYAVGDGGTVMRSDDAGQTWIGLPSKMQEPLSKVQVLDANTVVVAGGCTLSESTDGGASFRRLAVTARRCPSDVASFSFLTASTGFVELKDGEILLTNDGGQTVETRRGASGADHVGQIKFLSPATGFALTNGQNGGEIRRTLDGASTWETVASSPSPLSDITFVTPTTAYAVGANSTMLRSTDGGATWQLQPLTLPPGSPRLSFGRIACGDVLHCVITAEARSQGDAQIVRTADGGTTGSVVQPSEEANLLGPVLLSVTAVAFPTPATAVAVGQEGGMFLSHDAGATFQSPAYSLLEGVPNDRRMRLGQSSLDAYMALEAGAGIAATTDGGLTWNELRIPTGWPIVDYAFPSVQVGYVVDGSGTVFKTTTAGRTWSILSSVGAAPSALLAPNVSTVVVIRSGGVERSTDGGASFKSFDPSVVVGRNGRRLHTARLSAFDIANGAELAGGAIFAFGDPLLPREGVFTDSVLESIDGGLHWTRLPSPVAREGADAISFVSSTTGYESCDDRLFFTRNRGRTWRQILSLGSNTEQMYPPVNISFSSERVGYVLVAYGASGFDTTLLRTEDGGRSWVPQQLPGALSQVTAGGAVDYTVGEDPASIFRTTHGGLSVNRSALTLGIVGPRHVSASKPRSAGGRVRLEGHLRPAVAGAQITISYVARHAAFWKQKTATSDANGRFALVISGIRATTEFVAHWSGTDLLGGAGTPAVQLDVAH